MTEHVKTPFRIGKLRLRNFKGWGNTNDESFDMDTDANIVLLTGANGCGKTGILEAINLVLNNHCFDLRGDGKSQGDRLNQLIHEGCGSFHLQADLQNYGGGNISVRFQSNDEQPIRDDDYWRKEVFPIFPDSATDLLSAATAYFQDRIDTILRDFDRATTLREWLVPLPQEVNYLRDAVKRFGDQLESMADSEEQKLEKAREPNSLFVEGAERFREAWRKLREDAGKIPGLALPDAPDKLHENLVPFANDVAAFADRKPMEEFDHTMMKEIFDAAIRRIKHLIKQHERERPERHGAREEMRRAREELAKLDHTHPEETANRVEAQFSGDLQSGAPGLRQILRGVEMFLEQWRDFHPDLPNVPMLAPIQNELARLDAGAAAVLRAILDQWEGPWVEAQTRRKALRKRIEELQLLLPAEESVETKNVEQALKSWRETWFEEQRRRKTLYESSQIKKRVQNRRRLAKVLKQELSEGAFIRLQPLEDPVKKALNRALDGTLVRFQFDQDFLPVRVRDQSRTERLGETRQGYELHTRDKRPSFVMSTGQRGQVALAYMLAQALLLGRQLPHRILILDDTSTAFDLGNIVRQATWLRQLAYNPEPERRWQVFVASHHEELTNRLIELLVPPEGAELRLIRFSGWSRETGPSFEQHRARRNPPCGDERVRTAFQEQLRRAWSDVPSRMASNG